MAMQMQMAGHMKDLGGGFTVRRLLPAARQRSVGPFIFFDHFGPATEQPRPITMCGRIRTSAWRRSRICSKAR